MKRELPRILWGVLVVLAACLVSGCINPIVDSWSGETVDEALVTYDGVTYDIPTLQSMSIEPGQYPVIVSSPNHHPVATTITVGGGADVPPIRLVPYRRVYSPLVADALLCRAIDIQGTPIGPGWNYTAMDAQVVAWVRWNILDTALHYQTTRWYRPDGVLYREEALPPFARVPGSPMLVTAPGLALQQSPGWGVAPPAAIPGIWIVEIVLDGTLAAKMSFAI